jgi:hypothetical protein
VVSRRPRAVVQLGGQLGGLRLWSSGYASCMQEHLASPGAYEVFLWLLFVAERDPERARCYPHDDLLGDVPHEDPDDGMLDEAQVLDGLSVLLERGWIEPDEVNAGAATG